MAGMSNQRSRRVEPPDADKPRRHSRDLVGWFFLWTSGIHVGIAAVAPYSYRHFADAAVMDWVENGWQEIFMAHPRAWGLTVAAGELALGLLLLRGGRAAKAGWIAVVGFHFALVLFGWTFLLYAAPALVVLVTLARRDWPRLGAHEPDSSSTATTPR